MKKAENQMLTQQGIKALHLQQVYLNCLRSGKISRAQLRREMGLSFPSVSALVDELIENSILEETGTSFEKNRGRPSVQLQVRAGNFAIPVVAMTYNGYRCTLFDLTTEELESCFIPYGFYDDSVNQVNGSRCPDFEALAGPLVRWVNGLKKQRKLIGLVMSAPGSVNEEGVLSSSSIRITTPAGFPDRLESATGLKLHLGNPSDYYAYAEYHCSRDTENFALILISNGVGAAIVRNGMLMEVKPRRAGEFGHISIDFKGRPCICGGCGCLERYISTTALAEDAGLDYETLCQRYLAGDPQISTFIREKADILATGISNMLTMQPVKQIVLGGEIQKLGEPFLETLRQSIRNIGFRRLMQELDVRYAVNPDGAEVIGALWNFVENQMEIYRLLNL